MNKVIITLMAALGLTMSALTTQAANIQITSLPFNITAPGTYVLASNLSYAGNSNAITINTPLPGPVIVDLESFTLNGNNNASIGVFISTPSGNPNSDNITIRNGIIQNFNQ